MVGRRRGRGAGAPPRAPRRAPGRLRVTAGAAAAGGSAGHRCRVVPPVWQRPLVPSPPPFRLRTPPRPHRRRCPSRPTSGPSAARTTRIRNGCLHRRVEGAEVVALQVGLELATIDGDALVTAGGSPRRVQPDSFGMGGALRRRRMRSRGRRRRRRQPPTAAAHSDHQGRALARGRTLVRPPAPPPARAAGAAAAAASAAAAAAEPPPRRRRLAAAAGVAPPPPAPPPEPRAAAPPARSSLAPRRRRRRREAPPPCATAAAHRRHRPKLAATRGPRTSRGRCNRAERWRRRAGRLAAARISTPATTPPPTPPPTTTPPPPQASARGARARAPGRRASPSHTRRRQRRRSSRPVQRVAEPEGVIFLTQSSRRAGRTLCTPCARRRGPPRSARRRLRGHVAIVDVCARARGPSARGGTRAHPSKRRRCAGRRPLPRLPSRDDKLIRRLPMRDRRRTPSTRTFTVSPIWMSAGSTMRVGVRARPHLVVLPHPAGVAAIVACSTSAADVGRSACHCSRVGVERADGRVRVTAIMPMASRASSPRGGIVGAVPDVRQLEDVGALLDQQLDEVGVAAAGGLPERRPRPTSPLPAACWHRPAARVGAAGEQLAHALAARAPVDDGRFDAVSRAVSSCAARSASPGCPPAPTAASRRRGNRRLWQLAAASVRSWPPLPPSLRDGLFRSSHVLTRRLTQNPALAHPVLKTARLEVVILCRARALPYYACHPHAPRMPCSCSTWRCLPPATAADSGTFALRLITPITRIVA